MYLLTIDAEAARDLMLPSLWSFFASMGGSKSSIGILASVYSFRLMLSVVP